MRTYNLYIAFIFMNLKTLIGALGLLFLMSACQQHIIEDAAFRTAVHDEFMSRKALFTQGNVFDVFATSMTVREREAMEYLYSSMNTADMGDYTGEYFLENVRMAFRAKDEMPWGKDIPNDLFLYSVLPVRINNERLDDFRKVYYDTLSARVQGMNIHEAALEINHWCHEHVVYVPTDARTLSPMACMVNAEGRCGEESTFAVAAMRTVGIPARQVYTPRWAHTDDNHAWVEVWVDGKWQFLGACEPEPDLNMAWFNQPASRALLMHTRINGMYRGDEDIIQRTKCFTEINVIDTYAPIRQSTVTVVDAEDCPVPDALVEFKIYNYAEFYSVVKLKADKRGQVSLHSGLGDMLVWASHNGKFGFGKLCSEQLTVKLLYKEGDEFAFMEDIVPPVPGDIPTSATDEAIAHNKARMAQEDAVRHRYLATFFTLSKAEDYTDEEIALLVEARGNWRNVKAFIDGTHGNERSRAIALLKVLPVKDLHDTALEVLQDVLQSTPVGTLTEDYVKYVLSPRIAMEFIQPYRTAIRAELTQALGQQPSVASIIDWVKANITVADEYNPIYLQGTPAGVLRLRHADHKSRNRFFVAACRSFGIPAHMQTITGNPQYLSNGQWIEVEFEGKKEVAAPRMGYLETKYDKRIVKATPRPGYESHYTIARIDNGSFNTIYVDAEDVKDFRSDFVTTKYNLDEGYYMLTTGNRMASGKVLANCVTFNVREGQTSKVDLYIRPASNDIAVIGSMNPEEKYLPEGGKEEVSILSTSGRGYFLVAVLGSGDEPTNHALHDFAAISNELKEWGRPFVVMSPSDEDAAKFNKSLLKDISVNYGIDRNAKVKTMLCGGCNSSSRTLPVIALCDSFGRIVYFSQGYNTSIGEQLKSVIHKL